MPTLAIAVRTHFIIDLPGDNERATTERSNNLFFWDANHAPMFTTNPGYVWADAVKAAGLPASTPAPSRATCSWP